MLFNPFKAIPNAVLFILILILWALDISGQEQKQKPVAEHESGSHLESGHDDFKHWRIAGGIGHSYLPAGNYASEEVSVLVIPTIGLDFQYWFNPKFGLALKNELEIISYVLEKRNSNELQREYPLISVLVGMYKLHNGPSFYLGGGVEYEKHENFFIAKVGIEYELEIGRHWDVTPEIYYFNKDAEFGGIGITITFGKRF